MNKYATTACSQPAKRALDIETEGQGRPQLLLPEPAQLATAAAAAQEGAALAAACSRQPARCLLIRRLVYVCK